MKKKVLIIDDDTSFGLMVSGYLKKNDMETTLVGSFSKARTVISKEDYDLILSDYRLPDGNGLEVLRYAKNKSFFVPVVLITAYSDIRVAVNAIKEGACEYITKPVNARELIHVIQGALKSGDHRSSLSHDYIVGDGENTREMNEHIQLVAPTEVAVLIQGESGTGKEYVARRIHELSRHKNGPFVAVDCGALTPEIASSELFGHVKGSFTGAFEDKTGHFESVGKGTIFLDEVGNLSYDVQMKLLRALQERRAHKVGGNSPFAIEARIIAASNDDLRQKAMNGEFREDLYHRLNEFTVSVPPLRERSDELIVFANHFCQQAAHEFEKQINGFSDEVLKIFEYYDWPGNLRELRNVIRRAVLLSKNNIIESSVIPPEIIEQSKNTDNVNRFSEAKDMAEKQMIEEALRKVKNNKTKAAWLLGIDRKTLYNKLQKFKIDY
ncbi:sigma-54-dependent transcriptional regulator [Anaerophaga thermohalophila]|uniref:sigma-54-dependent transcriptional regulator n=1 Tax=Anaerophaga thermohalophila TaxID=177400 RepID=UPI0002E7383F|nr:sigma-54 dependent transcriptional regulator [Anaerophaga thermohalophila]